MAEANKTASASCRSELVLRLLGGEDLDQVASSSGVPVEQLREWRRQFVAAGTAILATDAEDESGNSFEVQLLGVPQVRRWVDGRPETLRWGLRRALMCFAYLALAPQHRARKDELEGALWPLAGPREVRRNFHPTLSAVRRTLAGKPLADGGVPQLLIAQHGFYELAPGVDWRLDVASFTNAVEAGAELRQAGRLKAAAERWRSAWQLYRGPLLAGEEAEWIVDHRAELHGVYLGLLSDLGKVERDLDRPEHSIDAYRALLLQEPFEEHAHQALMDLYAGQGRRDLVRRQFVRLQELLAELNVEPMEATQQRFYELMR